MATLVRRAIRWAVRVIVVLMVVAVFAGGYQYWQTRQTREALWAAFAPIQITNCDLERFGPQHDGGYPLCGNLLQEAKAAYSYGIAGYDPWGCVVQARLDVPLHQYDCFETTVPVCPGNPPAQFHPECIGPKTETIDGRPYDTLSNQARKNGDAGKRLIVKMDVEGSEWQSLATAPDEILSDIDQLTIEFHDVETDGVLDTASRLAQFFYVAHVHQNNYACLPGFDPFPGPIFEALLVNKRIATANPAVITRGVLPIDSPNSPNSPDCQASPGGSEPARIVRWLRRGIGAAGARFFGLPFS